VTIPTRKPIVFISYAHADEPERPDEGEVKWLSFVIGYLRAAVKQDAIEIWRDELLRAGDNWNFEIERKLRECDIFLLLCSHNSLSSDYVVDKELAIVRERQKNGEDVRIVPLLLTPTPKIALELVNNLVIRPRDGKALSSYPPHERMERTSKVVDEIAEMAAEMAARPLRSVTAAPTIHDSKELIVWLSGHPPEVSQAIAVRAALRVLPLFVNWRERAAEPADARQFSHRALALFWASALARVVAKYPARANNFTAKSAVEAANAAARDAGTVGGVTHADAAYTAARAAAHAAGTAAYASIDAGAATDAANTALRAEDAYVAANLPQSQFWDAVSDDVQRLQEGSLASVIDAPLWPEGKLPEWARERWRALRNALRGTIADNRTWQVWFTWYEDRLAGGTRGEDWEMAFATAPEPVWRQGAAEANAWIVERLHAIGEAPVLPPTTGDPPPPVDGAVSPVAYGWVQRPDSKSQRRIAAVGGAHNFPLYSNAASEQDHQLQLALCRRNADWLLNEIERTRETNAIPRDYEPALRDYLDVLPQRAGEGSVALAYDELRYLYGLFERDVRQLPNAFASRLARLIENQLALNGFYDWPRRHQKAVAEGDWGKAAFPEEAVAPWRSEIAKHTPELFEPPVAEDIGRIEQAEPSSVPAEPLPDHVVGPPPLPAEAPDPKKSRQYQIAAAANALWGTFLKGKDLPVAIEGWSKTAQELGQAAKPFLDFLRDLMS